MRRTAGERDVRADFSAPARIQHRVAAIAVVVLLFLALWLNPPRPASATGDKPHEEPPPADHVVTLTRT